MSNPDFGQTCSTCGHETLVCKDCKVPLEKRRIGLVGIIATTILVWCLLSGAQFIISAFLASHEREVMVRLGAPTSSWQTFSNIGESFGVLNCLVSALAFGGVIFSISLQSTELRYQRQVLIDTRTEMTASVAAQQTSAEALTKQIDALKVTARIDGLGAVLRGLDAQISNITSRLAKPETFKTQALINELRHTLENLQGRRELLQVQLLSLMDELTKPLKDNAPSNQGNS